MDRKPYRVLVCGGRDYADRKRVFDYLDRLWREAAPLDALEVIQGGATGADALAREWCCSREVPYVNVPANWKLLGKAAGPIRNQRMIDEYGPSLVLAFPGGRGTADMVSRAHRARITVVGVPIDQTEAIAVAW